MMSMLSIRPITPLDWDFWMSIDRHTTQEGFTLKVNARLGYVIDQEGTSIGLFHYCLLWDRLPFLNLLYLLPENRNRGFGTAAMAFWEAEMRKKGFEAVLISTQVDENAQFFYRKLGYLDCGGLMLNEGSLKQPMELFMIKYLT